MPIPLLAIAGITAGAKALAGVGQMLFAPKRRPEPKYEIPKEVFEVTQRAREMEQTGMPEASRVMAEQRAEQSALFAMRSAQDRRGGLMSQGNIQAQQNLAALSIASQDAAMRQQNMVRTQQALMTQAGYRDKAFANQWQAAMNREQQRRALLGAGMQNIMGGFDLFGSMMALGLNSTATKTTTTTPTTGSTASVSPRLPFGSTYQFRPAANTIMGLPSSIQYTPSFPSIG